MTAKSQLPKEAAQLQSHQQTTSNKEDSRPGVVRVFGRNFYILYSSLLEGGMTDLGLTHYDEGLVNIRNSQHPIEEKDTLLHEFIHVVDQLMGCEMSERQVTLVAHGLIGIFQDNPEFAEFIIKKIDT
jgi:hypothetical protein